MLYTSFISSLCLGKILSLCCRVTIGHWSPRRFLNCLFSRPANALQLTEASYLWAMFHVHFVVAAASSFLKQMLQMALFMLGVE